MEGTKILHYEIEKLLGSGGMGSVYKALDTNLNTYRALKFLHPGLAGLDYAKAHLLREARTQAKLFHPNIAALLELQKTDEHTFLVMEYVDGPTLDVYLAESNPPIKERLNLIIQVACALDAAHSRGILHRDIKPKNVLISADGTAKVTDFGLAKISGQSTLTFSGEIKGTAPYMAPEAFRGGKIGSPSDIWSLGVMTHEVLQGKLPFSGKTFETLAYQIVNEPHPPLSKKVQEILPGMSEFLDASLNKNEKNRLEDGSEALLALTGIGARVGLSSSIADAISTHARRKKQTKILRRTVPSTLLGLLIVAGLLIVNSRPSKLPELFMAWSAVESQETYTWDPSGRYLASISNLGGLKLQIRDITQSVAVVNTISIETDWSLELTSWAPDSSYVALSGEAGLFLLDTATHQPIRLVDYKVQRVCWSKGSDLLIYSPAFKPDNPNNMLELIGPISKDWQGVAPDIVPIPLAITGLPLPYENITLYDPVFILNDSYIAFWVDRDAQNLGIFIVPVTGGTAQQLISGDLCPRYLDWDDNSASLFFYGMAIPDIYQLNVTPDGAASRSAQPLMINGIVRSFDYHTPTGTLVVCTTLETLQIWRLPFTSELGQDEKVVNIRRESLDAIYTPSLSYDQRELFFSAINCQSGLHLFQFEFDSNALEELLPNDLSLSNEWFPAPDPIDRRYIAFCAVRGGANELFIYNRGTREIELQLTVDPDDDPAEESFPAWAADGSAIYFVRKSEGIEQLSEIRKIEIDRSGSRIRSGPEEIVITGQNLSYPFPDKSGRFILFQTDDDSLNVIDTKTGSTKTLTKGQRPVLSLSRDDVYYIYGSSVYKLINWTNAFEQQPEITLIRQLPQNVTKPGAGSTLTVANDAVYATLFEAAQDSIRLFKLPK